MTEKISEDLKQCVTFHGHLCPGLIYGYIVAREARNLLSINRSADEEVVTVSENDSCAVDAFQVLLGTSTGKGNLIIKNYGKNAYTVFSRLSNQAYRFSRITGYAYTGDHEAEFKALEAKVAGNTATTEEKKRQKYLKAMDLLHKPFETVFATKAVPWLPPEYAELAPSKACAICGEMTMATKMKTSDTHGLVCIPCAAETGL